MASVNPDLQVRILTLNCWGLKYVSSKRKERIDAIGRRLETCSNDYDIVALQEVWVESDYELLRSKVSHYLPFAKRWYSGILAGPGLAVFSRWPIESAWIFRFPLNGRPSAFWRGDWYVGKAAGCCVILHPCGQRLEVINAHLHAPYAPSGDASYSCHRASQAWDVSGIVKRAILSGHATFVTGDLNARPQSVGMRLFEHRGMLSDAWLNTVQSHKEYDSTEVGFMSPQDQIELAGVTSDSQLNTWRKHYSLDRAKRLDYIFYDASQVIATDSSVTFTEPASGVGSLSDHFGFRATFQLRVNEPPTRKISDRAEMASLHAELLKIIENYKVTSEFQRTWRIAHWWLSLGIITGLLVAVWWGAADNRSYVGFIFLIVSVVTAITGAVNGLIGFLFGRNERRALAEFEDQVKLSLDHSTSLKMN